MSLYYRDKLGSLRRIFGVDEIEVGPSEIRVGGRSYPTCQDVILLSPSSRSPLTVPLEARSGGTARAVADGSEAVRDSFGHEWTSHPEILPEHREEFEQYFDLLPPARLKGLRVCDLGCGNGRWSHFLKDDCEELILIDFSEAIFVARRNLAGASNCLFFMGDLRTLPFRPDFCDLIVCLGVLHHLPTPCLDEVRRLRPLAPRLLVFLYYALDNRPAHYRWLLGGVTLLRRVLSRIRARWVRRALAAVGAVAVYRPMVLLGAVLARVGLGSHVPLYDFYRNKSLRRIRQDVYDRFFTPIEQRVSRAEILSLQPSFSQVIVSDQPPYWHFLCLR